MISPPTLIVLRAAALQTTISSIPIARAVCHTALRTSRSSFAAGPKRFSCVASRRTFSSSKAPLAKNRIFTPVRTPSELQSYILRSTSARIPLVTFWTASYCPTCKVVGPLLQRLVESGVGETAGVDGKEGNSIMYAEVEYDSPDMMEGGMGMQYMISSLPTLMTFDRGEAILDTKTTDGQKLKSEKFLKEWIEREAQRRGEGTSGSGGGGGFFGGLFGNARK